MPRPVKVSTEQLQQLCDTQGVQFIHDRLDDRKLRRVAFRCTCDQVVDRPANWYWTRPELPLLCKRCTTNKVKPPVSRERIEQRLSEYGSQYVAHEVTETQFGRKTQVTFKCGGYKDHPCGVEVTRFWNDVSRKDRKPLCQKCAQPRLRGKDHHLYNPELTDREREDSRWRAADREWAQQIFERDQYICRITGQQGGRLSAHHLNSRTRYPHLKYDLANGITISEELHQEFHQRPGCKRNSTAAAFVQFYLEKTGRYINLPDYILNPQILKETS